MVSNKVSKLQYTILHTRTVLSVIDNDNDLAHIRHSFPTWNGPNMEQITMTNPPT